MRRILRSWPGYAGAIAATSGVLVLVGWWLGIRASLPGIPAMQPNTALMAALTGLGLWLVARARTAGWSKAAGRFCAVAVVAVAVLTLVEYVLAIDLQLDHLVASGDTDPIHRLAGRPSPQTATAFALAGFALLLLGRSIRRGRVSDYLALVSGSIGILALLGYLFGVEQLYGVPGLLPHIGMSPITASIVVLLATGVLAIDVERSVIGALVVDDAGGITARRLLLGLTLFIPIAVAIMLASRMRWLAVEEASALVLFVALVESSAFILTTAHTLSSIDRKAKKASAALVASEHSLRETSAELVRAQTVAEVGSWRLDVQSGELRWSDETYRLFGIAAGTPMSYQSFLACVHPEDRAYIDARWTAALRGTPYDVEHRIVVPGGAIRWVRERADLEFDARGALVGGIGIVQNLTDRKRLEDELRLSEARSSGILAISADAIVSIDDDHRITMFNEGAERIFGYSRAEALGSPLDLLIPERLREGLREHVERFAAGEVVSRRVGAPIVGMRKTGEEFPADASISKLAIDGTRILTVALRDITQEKRIEAEHALLAEAGSLLSSTLDFEQTLANVADLAVRDFADFCTVDVIDEAGELRRLKVACRDPADAWICHVIEQIRIDPARPYLTGPAFETGRPALLQQFSPDMLASFARDDEHLAALRAIRARSAIVAPLVARGALLGAIGFVSARSSRIYGEDDLRLAEELARRAALSIDNARLYREARRAIQSRDDVLAVVAHDLRNPLNAIILQAELLRLPGTERPGAPDAIRRSATRMNRLIEDLLDVARIDAGKLSVDRDRVSTPALLSDVIQAHAPLAASASIDLQLDAPAELPELWADRHRVLQVFENLVGNALKFTPSGGRIVVGAAAREREVLFWVSDTGPGIAVEHQPHIFDRFWQGRDARRRGAGLGLPIVKGFVEVHGGRIWLESTPGRGSTFFFTIPVASLELWPSSALAARHDAM